MNYAFVTVAHQADSCALRLQARSLQRYLPGDLGTEIVVVGNPQVGKPTHWRDELLSEYGDLWSRVHFIESKDIARIPSTVTGWVSQQILKLMVSQIVRSDRYVVLDAKNHLVFPLTRDFLEVGHKVRSRLTSYENHPLKGFLEAAARYFGLDAKEKVRKFLPTITPFTFPTQLVRNLIDYVTELEQKPFPEAFVTLGVTEFFLFGSFISSRGMKIEDTYDLSGVPCPIIWEETAMRGAVEVEAQVSLSERSALPFFSVHRRAVQKLNTESRVAIASLWQRRGLFTTTSDGLSFLADMSRAN